MIRRRVLVSGRVQGVWFRDGCRREATRLGVAGWVRNCDDGRVEAVFEGAPYEVEAMVEWSRHGPPGALVGIVETFDEPPSHEAGFHIVR